MSVFAPSTYQSAIFDWIRTGSGSAIVKAVAGSGKTTTVIRGVQYFSPSFEVQLVAFNKDIVTEMEVRLKKLEEEIGRRLHNVRISTFHSLGFSALRGRFKPRRHTVDDRKLSKLMPEACGYSGMLEDLYGAFCCKLVGLAKGEGVGILVADEPEIWQALIDHHGLCLDDERATEDRAISIARDLLRHSVEAALMPKPTDSPQQMRMTIDYSDMLYLPILWNLRFWPNDALIIDEAQDTNRVRREIAKRALRANGRLMAVGDPRQGIYGFTGASHDALDQIKATFSCVELPLTVSYRCARSIIARAQKLVPYLEAFEGAQHGEIVHLSCAQAVQRLKPSDVILCRMTGPLVSFAFDLIRHGIGCRVLGRDIGTGLIKLIKGRDADTIPQLELALEKFRDEEVAKFIKKGREEAAAGVQDRVNCILAVIEEMPEKDRTVGTLIARLESLFDDDAGRGLLTLSTIHKAKGKEWDSVAILQPNLMPCQWAKQEWQQLQELNIMYVAWTRAKNLLIDLTDTRIVDRRAKAEPMLILPLPLPTKDGLPELPAFLDRRPKRAGGAS